MRLRKLPLVEAQLMLGGVESNQGLGALLLLPNESSYLECLRLRKVPLVEAQLMR